MKRPQDHFLPVWSNDSDRLKTISSRWLMYSELWMLFRQGGTQLLCWASLLLDPLREAEHSMNHTFISFPQRLITLHSAHYVWRAARKLPLTTLLIVFYCRGGLCSHLLRAVAHLYEGQKHLRSSPSASESSDVTWHRLSFKQAFWEIWVNRVEVRLRSHVMAW